MGWMKRKLSSKKSKSISPTSSGATTPPTAAAEAKELNLPSKPLDGTTAHAAILTAPADLMGALEADAAARDALKAAEAEAREQTEAAALAAAKAAAFAAKAEAQENNAALAFAAKARAEADAEAKAAAQAKAAAEVVAEVEAEVETEVEAEVETEAGLATEAEAEAEVEAERTETEVHVEAAEETAVEAEADTDDDDDDDEDDDEEADAPAKAAEKETVRVATLSEEELLALKLEAHLAVDASATREGLEKASAALKATEAALIASREAHQRDRAEGTERIGGLEAQVSAVEAVLRTVELYDEQCVALRGEVKQLAEREEQRRLDTHNITGRVRKELDEAEKRLRQQEERSISLQKTVDKAAAENSARKAKQVMEIGKISSDVAARELKATLARQHLSMLRVQQARLTDQLEAAPRALADKVARAEATQAEVDKLMEAAHADEMIIAQRKNQVSEDCSNEDESIGKMPGELASPYTFSSYSPLARSSLCR